MSAPARARRGGHAGAPARARRGGRTADDEDDMTKPDGTVCGRRAVVGASPTTNCMHAGAPTTKCMHAGAPTTRSHACGSAVVGAVAWCARLTRESWP